jgi:hypothetical protein
VFEVDLTKVHGLGEGRQQCKDILSEFAVGIIGKSSLDDWFWQPREFDTTRFVLWVIKSLRSQKLK